MRKVEIDNDLYLILTQKDLLKSKSNKLAKDISVYDFKISIDDINIATTIIYLDNNKNIVLKSRFD